MVVREVPGAAYRLAGVLARPADAHTARNKTVADSVCAGLDAASVRMPSHPVALAVIHLQQACRWRLPRHKLPGSPSWQRQGGRTADMEGKDSLILLAARAAMAVESTVISQQEHSQGALRRVITKEQLEILMELLAPRTACTN